jgi:hypothetical protein
MEKIWPFPQPNISRCDSSSTTEIRATLVHQHMDAPAGAMPEVGRSDRRPRRLFVALPRSSNFVNCHFISCLVVVFFITRRLTGRLDVLFHISSADISGVSISEES